MEDIIFAGAGDKVSISKDSLDAAGKFLSDWNNDRSRTPLRVGNGIGDVCFLPALIIEPLGPTNDKGFAARLTWGAGSPHSTQDVSASIPSVTGERATGAKSPVPAGEAIATSLRVDVAKAPSDARDKANKIGVSEAGRRKNPDGSEVEYVKCLDGQVRPQCIWRPDGTGTRFVYDAKGKPVVVSQFRQDGRNEIEVKRDESTDGGSSWKYAIPKGITVVRAEYQIKQDGSYSLVELPTHPNKNPRLETYDTAGNQTVCGADGELVYELKRQANGSVQEKWFSQGKVSKELTRSVDGSTTLTRADGSIVKRNSAGDVLFQRTVNQDGSFVDQERQANGRLQVSKVRYSDNTQRTYKYNAHGFVCEMENKDSNGRILSRYEGANGQNFVKTAGSGPATWDGSIWVHESGREISLQKDSDGRIVRFVRGTNGRVARPLAP